MADSSNSKEVEELKKKLEEKDVELKNCKAENDLLKQVVEQSKVKIASLEKELARTQAKLAEINEHIQRSSPSLVLDIAHNHPDSPADIRGGSSAVVADKVYFRLIRSKTVLEYNSTSKEWKQMPSHPHNAFTLVCIDQTLTTVGGDSTTLYSLVSGKWETCSAPPLPTSRCVPAAVYSERKLVVAGGIDQLVSTPRKTQVVEVLDTISRQWTSVSPLPYGVHQTTIVRCDDSVYLSASHGPGSDILKCAWNELISSHKSSDTIWRTCRNFFVSNSTLEVLQGYLLAVGGLVNDKPTTAVYCYREILNRWEKIGDMSLARDECRTAVLDKDTLLVVGSHAHNNRKKLDILRLKPLRTQSLSVMA